MEQPKSPRILAIASAGGHWVQLRRLKPAFAGLDVAFASVFPDYAEDVKGSRYYSFDDVSRFKKLSIVKVVSQIFMILLRERPNVIITTGSFPGLLAITLGRYLFGARTIWIDSVANCERLSSSGSRAGKVAHTWLTQWEHLAGDSGPKFWGSVL